MSRGFNLKEEIFSREFFTVAIFCGGISAFAFIFGGKNRFCWGDWWSHGIWR
jgi:hypothetical protein